MKSLTYGILPSFEEFEVEYNKECPSSNYVIFYDIENDKIVGTRTFTSAKEMYDYLIWLKIKWEKGVEISDEYGNLAASILSTLNFEWV